MTFRDTHFTVTLRSEDVKSYYTTRVLELQNISVGPIPPGKGDGSRRMFLRSRFNRDATSAKTSFLFKMSYSVSVSVNSRKLTTQNETESD